MDLCLKWCQTRSLCHARAPRVLRRLEPTKHHQRMRLSGFRGLGSRGSGFRLSRLYPLRRHRPKPSSLNRSPSRTCRTRRSSARSVPGTADCRCGRFEPSALPPGPASVLPPFHISATPTTTRLLLLLNHKSVLSCSIRNRRRLAFKVTK